MKIIDLVKMKRLKDFYLPIMNQQILNLINFLEKLLEIKRKQQKFIEVKGRKLLLENFYNRIVKFSFDELCNRNLGSEDYIKIAENCDFIFIENLPDFDENNSNQQQRFITLIDIIYEKKIPLMIIISS